MDCLADFTRITVGDATVFHGSNLDVLPFMADASVDSIVTDPPYELGFMGKKWDSSGIAYSVELWQECLRVLKPGGHLLAFGGSRTWHRLAVAIEDAGFELRDSIAWLYGSGFPKSLDISKAIDKAAGAEREVIGTKKLGGNAAQSTKEKGGTYASNTNSVGVEAIDVPITAPATPEAEAWAGWGTALKPAFEPVVVARKPLIGTVAENVLAYGVGGLNIDASRIGTEQRTNQPAGNKVGGNSYNMSVTGMPSNADSTTVQGRWPANIILDEYMAELLDEQSGIRQAGGFPIRVDRTNTKIYGKYGNEERKERINLDSGGASRFFYVAKANKRDRTEGIDDNKHPTVKPTDLMRYLIKLVTPADGLVLDPFTGSGSTGKAALLDGYKFVGIELTDEYLPIIEGRLKWAYEQHHETLEKENEKLF